MSRYTNVNAMIDRLDTDEYGMKLPKAVVGLTKVLLDDVPSIDIVFCKECKHRPVKEDADEEDYGFNLIEPTEGDDRCPCLVDDGWYSWMPKDDFYCGFGEREDK